MRAARYLDLILLLQRGHLFPWSPVFFGLGIAGYFWLKTEPHPVHYGICAIVMSVAGVIAVRFPSGLSALGWALALTAAGICVAGLRANTVAGPVLDWRYYGPVEGRIIAIDRSSSDATRLTLDRVRMDRTDPKETPHRVRISLHGRARAASDFRPGHRIMTTAHLMPAQGPAEPDGFDFRRYAWFRHLGAVGYTRKPVLLAAPVAGRDLWIDRGRLDLSRYIKTSLGGEVGGFAAAVTTGDRSGVTAQTLTALRNSNLAHLLAISGLHMGLLAGFVFAAIRVGLNLWPYLALRIPVKRVAAAGALTAAAGYLALSGGNVATERAFIMVAVALVAVMLDRRAFSLRAVALAALIVLTRRPESLFGPGFQMSFAATTALIVVFGWLRTSDPARGRRWLRPIMGVVISSAVAGAATAPFGAAHFNTMAHYGLAANLLSVPMMGLLVIPSAVLALLLWPIGLSQVGLFLMGLGLTWILNVAQFFAGLQGAVGQVMSPGPAVLPLLALGFLFLALWQGRLRVLGVLPMVLSGVLWAQAERPDVLIDANGGLVGVMTQTGRALSKPKGAGFVAGIWLENDGDGSDQVQAASHWPDKTKLISSWTASDHQIIHVLRKRGAELMTTCQSDQIIVASVDLTLHGPCMILDSARLRQTGSISIHKGALRTAKQVTGNRLWTGYRHRPVDQ